ncbi:hypothetical protein JT358_14570 [Micrococcales bacterium 31B]|nr:hypothetical protein [Micrococcales bacterium 31B]
MKYGTPLNHETTARFVFSLPTEHGWQDFLATTFASDPALNLPALANATLAHPRRPEVAHPTADPGLGHTDREFTTPGQPMETWPPADGAHIVIGASDPREAVPPAAETPEPPQCPQRPAPLRFTPLPDRPENNVLLHAASALLPLVAAVGFALFAKNYWFLMLALTSPLLVLVSMKSQAGMHARKVRATRSQNFGALHLHRATHLAYLRELAIHLDATHPAVRSRATTPGSLGTPKEVSLRLGTRTLRLDFELDHDIAREISALRAGAFVRERALDARLPADPRLRADDVAAFARHLTGAEIPGTHLSSTRVVPALAAFRVPPVATTLQRDHNQGRGAGLKVRFTGPLDGARRAAAAVLAQLAVAISVDDITWNAAPLGRSEGQSTTPSSWLRRGLTWWPLEAREDSWNLAVAETTAPPAVEIVLRRGGAGSALADRSELVTLGVHLLDHHVARVQYQAPPPADVSFGPPPAPDRDPRSSTVTDGCRIAWEGLEPPEWDARMRVVAGHAGSARERSLAPVPFEDLHRHPAPSPATAPTGRAILGVALHGDQAAPLECDLVEDGPHVFVAGTTGSGKSEFMRSLVASLCLHSGPRDLQLVLLDFKGGAGFDELATLPQVAEVITNLDAYTAQRSLRCLLAEMHRRQRIFRDAGVTSWPEYWQLVRSRGDASRPLVGVPRLVVVVDEFRVLLEDLPDTRGTFTRIAALGRSLGVHLILATQRPGGALSADLAANVGLRVCLRVNDRMESIETLGSPLAAGILRSTPGRAYVTRESAQQSAAPITFQSTMLRGAAVTEDEATSMPGVRVQPYRGACDTTPPASRNQGLPSLAWVGTRMEATSHVPRSPLLPPLPRVLDVSALNVLGDALDSAPHPGGAVPLGILDDVDSLCLRVLQWRPSPGHTAIIGAPGAGKSHTLWLLATLVAEHGTPRVQARGESLRDEPSSGDSRVLVVRGAGERREAEASHHARIDVFAGRDLEDSARLFDVLGEAASKGQSAPLLVCIDDVDRWLAELTPSSYHSPDATTRTELLGKLQQLISAPQQGVCLVLSGSRKVLSSTASSACDQFVLLRPSEPQDYAMLGVSSQSTAALNAPGRCFARFSNAPLLEGQVLRDSSAAGRWLNCG